MIILAGYVFGESAKKQVLLAATLGIIGVVIVADPVDTDVNWGIILLLFAAIIGAGSSIHLRAFSHSSRLCVAMCGMLLTEAALALPMALLDWRSIDYYMMIGIVLLAILFLSTIVSLTCSYKRTSTASIAIFEYGRLPLAALIGAFVFSEFIAWHIWLGAGVIIVANTIAVLGQADRPAGR